MVRGATPGRDPAEMVLITLERGPDGREIELGQMVTATAVEASNLLRDAREIITNAFGGRMRRYENLLEIMLARGETRFRERLVELGYDGALGVRFSNPKIVDGGAELVVYGTGFRFKR